MMGESARRAASRARAARADRHRWTGISEITDQESRGGESLANGCRALTEWEGGIVTNPIVAVPAHLVGRRGWDFDDDIDERLGAIVAYESNPARVIGTVIAAPRPGVVEVMWWDFDKVDDPTKLIKWGELVVVGRA